MLFFAIRLFETELSGIVVISKLLSHKDLKRFKGFSSLTQESHIETHTLL